MNKNRRDFLRNFGAKAASTAAAAAAVATPAIDYASEYASQYAREIKADMLKLSDDLHAKLSNSAAEFGERLGHVSNRVDAIAIQQAYQQVQLHIIFMLLVVSFAIDGGMSLAWLFTP